MNKKIVKSTILLTSLCLVLSQGAFASDNKELLKMDLDQSSDGSVKLNIYTDKPYNEQVIVNKKPDNKYVILLPETVNSMGIKPDISGISNVKGIDVKTQQYSSLPTKGYTKITIDGKRPIEIVPQTHVSRAVTTSRSQSSSARRPYVTPQQVQMTVPQRVLNQSKPVTNNDFVPSYERQRQYNNTQTATRQYQQPSQNYVSRPTTRQETIISQPQRAVQQFAQTVQQAVQPQVQQPSQVVETTQNSNALTENEQVALEDNNNQAVDDANAKQLADNDDDITEDDLAFFKKIIRFKQKVNRKIKQILSFRISFSTFIGLAQFALLIVLIKVIGDLLKKIQYPSEVVESRPVTKRLIHNNNETFDQAYPSYSNMDVYNTSRSNFEEDNKEGFNIKPLSASSSFANASNNLYSNGNMLYNQQQPTSQSYIQHNDFYQPLNKISKEDKMSIFDEKAEDIERTIFKNPLKQISAQEEQTLFDEEEPASFNSPFNNQDEYSIQEQEDDFFNYKGNSQNDDDFFIFEDEDENEDDIEYQEDYVDEEDDESEYDDNDAYEYEYEYEYEDDGEEEQEATVPETPVANETPAPVTDPFEHLTVKSKYVIDAKKGFALVSVDGLNALIGYVGSKISVIRKFNEEINDKMQVRLNEQADENTLIYIIRVGKFKTLVEVKPDSIRQLLDL